MKIKTLNYQQCRELTMEDNTDYFISNVPAPYGMTYRLYYNKNKHKFIKETPSSGSMFELIDESEARLLMEQSVIVPRT